MAPPRPSRRLIRRPAIIPGYNDPETLARLRADVAAHVERLIALVGDRAGRQMPGSPSGSRSPD